MRFWLKQQKHLFTSQIIFLLCVRTALPYTNEYLSRSFCHCIFILGFCQLWEHTIFGNGYTWKAILEEGGNRLVTSLQPVFPIHPKFKQGDWLGLGYRGSEQYHITNPWFSDTHCLPLLILISVTCHVQMICWEGNVRIGYNCLWLFGFALDWLRSMPQKVLEL